MTRKKRRIIYLVTTILSIVSLLYIIFFLSPTTPLVLGMFQIPPLYLFLASVTLATYFISGLIMKNAIHGILISSFALTFFLLRLNNLRTPIFLILLLALFIVLEIFVSSKKAS